MRSVQRGLLVVMALSTIIGCRKSDDANKPKDAPASKQITVSVTIPAAVRSAALTPLRGDLGVFWLSAEEAVAFKSGKLSLRTMLDFFGRMVIHPNIDLTAPDRAEDVVLSVPVDDAVMVAVLDRGHEFESSVFGGGKDGTIRGTSAPVSLSTGRATKLALPLDQVQHVEETEHCQGERFKLEMVNAPEVAGEVGNATSRRLCVHLPPSYERSRTRRYPVIYAFAGIMGSDTSGSILQLMKATDEDGQEGREAIVVGVDVRTKYGSSYLEPSSFVGDFDSFVTKDAVAHLDKEYRTQASASKRAVLGQSTGGFNVMSIGIRHPDVFGTIVASSPDALDFGPWLLEPDGQHVRPRWLAWMRLADQVGPAGQMQSYAADWSPDPRGHHGLAWPADLNTGVIVPEVLNKWLRHSPSTLMTDPAIVANVKARLSGRIMIAGGTQDEADLFAPAQRFSEQLKRAGIEHTFAPDHAGHFNPPERMKKMVDFALSTMSRKE